MLHPRHLPAHFKAFDQQLVLDGELALTAFVGADKLPAYNHRTVDAKELGCIQLFLQFAQLLSDQKSFRVGNTPLSELLSAGKKKYFTRMEDIS